MSDALLAEAVALPPSGRSHVLRRFLRHRLAVLGVVLIALLGIAAAGAPWLAPYDPDDIDITARYAPPLTQGHVLGTDDLGRDVATRIMYAGRISLSVG